MIDGVPGTGKTTFIKRLCYIWAQSVLRPEERESEDDYLQKYTLVIPIILRFVKEQNTMVDILTSQLQCLSICENCAVINHQETKPDEVLLLLDGFDEYTGRSTVIKVISKEENPLVLCITTSRPHGIEQLRRYTSQAVDQHVMLCGFSHKQIKEYIRKFVKHHNLPEQNSKQLIDTLFSERKKKLLEVARTPIWSEMICVVWAKYGKLGETLADLYELIVIFLITHQKSKLLPEYKHEGEPTDILEENKELLLLVAQVAYTWEKYGRLRIVFNTKELQLILRSTKASKGSTRNKTFNQARDIGLIIKSHPSNDLEQSKWSFPHLTIQEYFVAYFLGEAKDIQIVNEFASRCKEYKVLKRCEVIFMFLCSKYPDVANKILTLLVHVEKDKNMCKDLLNFILKLIKYYESSKINIAFPCFVDIKSIDEQINESYGSYNKEKRELLRSSLNSLLKSEKRQKKPNLHSLTVCNILQYRGFMDLTYLQKLDVEVRKQEELSMLKQKIQHMQALESLSVQSYVSFTDVDLLSSVPTNKLTSLSMTGPDAMKAAADHIQKFTILQKLHIDETSNNYTEETRNKLISSLKSKNNIKEVSLCLPHLDDRMIQEKLNMKVKLQVKEKTLRKDTLRKAVRGLDLNEGMKAVRGLDSTGGLYKIDLSGNSLKDEGESLGQLMARMTTLRVMDVRNCCIHADTVQAMVQTIKEIKVTSGLHGLYMGRYRCYNDNNLNTGGCYLGELIVLIPDLYTLDLGLCKLTDTDLANMSDAVPATTNIHNLNLQYNNLCKSSEGLVSLLSHAPHLQALAVGGYDSHGERLPDPIPALCRAADDGSLTGLHVLDMWDSKLQPGSLKKLGQHLQYMNQLQVINLDRIQGVESEDYRHVFSNMPPFLQHLNVYTRHYSDMDVYLVLEHQYHLSQLHRLNVNLPYSDMELLQEVLEQNNSQIHVYNNRDEYIWKMYVKDKEELN